TLGTGVGTAVFQDGSLAPHLELSQHPFRKGETYNEQLGDDARRRIGPEKWSRRVEHAIETLDRLLMFDHLFIGGGNARRLRLESDPRTTIVDNAAGILGGIRLWDGHLL
ncbi:MAG: ROK family protein, partial [Acidimicrobiales bacterium]